jgi:hypothetical protein
MILLQKNLFYSRAILFTSVVIFFETNRFQANMVTYQNLITKSMYDKQLDSGKGTLLHLCDDVIQQEVLNHLALIFDV